jgi:L-alanine-DL-glutamate epimerase-like enolase superfamily enzyme
MADLTIKRITTEIDRRPLRHPFVTAQHTVTAMETIRVRVELSGGMVGVGACTPNAVVTGDTLASARTVIDEVLTPVLLGMDIRAWEPLLAKLGGAIHYNTPAKAGVELALWDLRAQLFNVPLATLLGGDGTTVRTDWTVSIASPDEMTARAREIVAAGFGAIKIKVGSPDLDVDLARIQAVARAVPTGYPLRLDANQGWMVREAIDGITRIQQLGLNIEFVEQPVRASDIDGLARVTAASALPIMADEAVFSPADALVLLQKHACDYINIKLMKTGGLAQAEQINALAAMYDVPCMIGCMIESRVSLSAAVAFAVAHRNVIFADLDAAFMEKDPEEGGFTAVGDTLTTGECPGLGFTEVAENVR